MRTNEAMLVFGLGSWIVGLWLLVNSEDQEKTIHETTRTLPKRYEMTKLYYGATIFVGVSWEFVDRSSQLTYEAALNRN